MKLIDTLPSTPRHYKSEVLQVHERLNPQLVNLVWSLFLWKKNLRTGLFPGKEVCYSIDLSLMKKLGFEQTKVLLGEFLTILNAHSQIIAESLELMSRIYITMNQGQSMIEKCWHSDVFTSQNRPNFNGKEILRKKIYTYFYPEFWEHNCAEFLWSWMLMYTDLEFQSHNQN